MKPQIPVITLFFLTSFTASANISYQDFLTNYYGNDSFVQDWVSQINNGVLNNQHFCLFNCGEGFATPIGFSKFSTCNKTYGILPLNLPYATLSINEVELNVLYNALGLAMNDISGEADSWVYIDDLGKIKVDNANKVFFVDEAGTLPGITLIKAWTWEGEACVKLIRESGSACGVHSCWNYDLSLQFKQVDESGYGRPLYINSNIDKPSVLFLDGYNRGGFEFYLTATRLPANGNVTCCYETTYQW